MEKIKKRLQQLTKRILDGQLDDEERKVINAELTTLRSLIATWRALDGYDGDFDPDLDSNDASRQRRTSTTEWD